jgi:hypothetical protein
MNRIGILGLSWRHVAPEQLASWTLPPPERAARLPRLARELGVHELVYIATCNRVEVAFVAEPGEPLAAYRPRLWRALRGVEPAPGEAERGLRAWGGEGAVEHLFLVAAGLDSARVGETEISAQVREAHDLARALGLAGPRLTRVFDEALRIARRVHALTAVGAGRVSLAELAIAAIRGARGDGRLPVALLGVSPMTERAGCELASAGVPLLVVNRTLAKGRGAGLRSSAPPRCRSRPSPRRRPRCARCSRPSARRRPSWAARRSSAWRGTDSRSWWTWACRPTSIRARRASWACSASAWTSSPGAPRGTATPGSASWATPARSSTRRSCVSSGA